MSVREYALKLTNLWKYAPFYGRGPEGSHDQVYLHCLQFGLQGMQDSHDSQGDRQLLFDYVHKVNWIGKAPREAKGFQEGLSWWWELLSPKERWSQILRWPNSRCQGSSNTYPRTTKDKRVSSMPQSPSCPKSERLHKGKCVVGSNACFTCVKLGHHAKDCMSGNTSPQGQKGQV